MKQNIIGLVDLHDREEELLFERDALEGVPLREWEEEYGDELKELESVIKECTWGDGLDTDLVHEDYFTEYVQRLCEDIGAVPLNFPHYIVIDWEATARNVKFDYSPIEFEGETYYYRTY